MKTFWMHYHTARFCGYSRRVAFLNGVRHLRIAWRMRMERRELRRILYEYF